MKVVLVVISSILILQSFFNNIKYVNCDITSLYIYSYNTQIIDFAIDIYNPNENDKQLLMGTICENSSVESIYEYCVYNYRNVRHRWFIMVDNVDLLKNISSYSKSADSNFTYLALIVNNQTVNSMFYSFVDKPVYLVNNDMYKQLQAYNITNEASKVFTVKIQRQRTAKLSSLTILLAEIFNFLILIAINIWWFYHALKLYRSESKLLQRILFPLTMLKILLSAFRIILNAFFYNDLSFGNPADYNTVAFGYFSFTKAYVEMTVYAVDFMYESFIILYIIAVAEGWQIIFNEFTDSAKKKLIALFILLDFILSLDKIIDAFFLGNNFSIRNIILTVSNIKNISVYCCLLSIIIIKSYKSIKYLKVRLDNAMLFVPSMIESLQLKIRIIVKNLIIGSSFYLIYIFIIVLIKDLPSKVIMTQFLHTLLLMLIMNNIKVSHLPNLFNLLIETSEDLVITHQKLSNVYYFFLPSLEDLCQDGDFCVNINKFMTNNTNTNLNVNDEADLEEDRKNNETKSQSMILIINPFIKPKLKLKIKLNPIQIQLTEESKTVFDDENPDKQEEINSNFVIDIESESDNGNENEVKKDQINAEFNIINHINIAQEIIEN